MTSLYIVGFLSAAAVSLILTPIVIHLAIRVGALDQPGGRKVHTRPMPRLGGVVVYCAFFLALALILTLSPSQHEGSWLLSREGLMFVASLLFVLILGIWDDLHTLKPFQKFLVQVFLATVAYLAGFRIDVVTHPFNPGPIELGLFSYPITVLWIVGVTNAVNLIDGLDGLAAGVATIAALTIFAVSVLGNDIGSATASILLAGALVGFIPYNFNPARIFLGDSGSLFLGLVLATVAIQGGTRAPTTFAIVIPILALGLPIMDTLLAMLRRFIRSVLTVAGEKTIVEKLTSMFLPDKSHIHHKLLARGISHRDTVLIMYVISLIFGLSALSVTVVNNRIAALILIIVGFATIFGIRRLRYAEMSLFRTGALLPLYQRPFVNRESFAFFLDFGFVLISSGAAFILITGSIELNKQFFAVISLISAPQLLFLWATGLHRRTIAHFGIGDGLGIGRSIFVSVCLSAMSLVAVDMLFPGQIQRFNLSVLLLDLYFLLTLVIGSRISFRILKYIFQRDSNSGRRVLIYGANSQGMLVLQRFIESEESSALPLGFLDDDPELEGKHLNGYPILGSHWRIPRLVRLQGAEEIVICSDSMTTEVTKRVMRYSSDFRLKLTRPRILFEDMNQVHKEPIRHHRTEHPHEQKHLAPSEIRSG